MLKRDIESCDFLCARIDKAIEAVSDHIQFWTEINGRSENEIKELGSVESLTEPSGQLRVGTVAESGMAWICIRATYKAYPLTFTVRVSGHGSSLNET